MVELKVISHISKQLNDFTTKVFALWNEADPVYNHIIGVGADVRDAYLRQERRKFFQELMASPSYELQIAVETTLDQLRNFWVDANEFYDANDEGNEADPVAWSLIKTYKTETFRYICELYYYILIRPELEAIEIFEDIPRLDRIQVRSYILRTGLLTEKRLDQYIRINKSEPAPDSQPGKAKKTRQEDAAAILDKTIEKVCNLLNGTVVKYDNNKIHWVFKGNAAQYAYFALKLKNYTGESTIRWEYLKEQVIFDTFEAQYNLLKKSASKFSQILKAQKNEGLPDGYKVIDRAFK